MANKWERWTAIGAGVGVTLGLVASYGTWLAPRSIERPSRPIEVLPTFRRVAENVTFADGQATRVVFGDELDVAPDELSAVLALVTVTNALVDGWLTVSNDESQACIEHTPIAAYAVGRRNDSTLAVIEVANVADSQGAKKVSTYICAHGEVTLNVDIVGVVPDE